VLLETEVNLFAHCSTELEQVMPVQILVVTLSFLWMRIKFENDIPNGSHSSWVGSYKCLV